MFACLVKPGALILLWDRAECHIQDRVRDGRVTCCRCPALSPDTPEASKTPRMMREES